MLVTMFDQEALMSDISPSGLSFTHSLAISLKKYFINPPARHLPSTEQISSSTIIIFCDKFSSILQQSSHKEAEISRIWFLCPPTPPLYVDKTWPIMNSFFKVNPAKIAEACVNVFPEKKIWLYVVFILQHKIPTNDDSLFDKIWVMWREQQEHPVLDCSVESWIGSDLCCTL